MLSKFILAFSNIFFLFKRAKVEENNKAFASWLTVSFSACTETVSGRSTNDYVYYFNSFVLTKEFVKQKTSDIERHRIYVA
jgi:hypothetical protein